MNGIGVLALLLGLLAMLLVDFALAVQASHGR